MTLPSCRGVLDREQDAGRYSVVAFVDQHGAALQQLAVAFERHVHDGIEQWVTRTDEGRERLAGRCYERLLEHDPLVAGQHRLADAERAVAAPDQRGHMGHLVAARLALAGRAAQPPECLPEERLDVVRLQATGFGPLHLFADAVYAARIHHVVHELALLEELLQGAPVERLIDRGVEPCPNLRLFAVEDGVE